MVSITNYERMAWGKIGLSLLPDKPLGYGLIEESFGKLTKQKWPESSLRQSHSGWLDLTLGIGIPGIILAWGAILGSCILSGRQYSGGITPLAYACRWILLAFLMMWFTAEISQRVFFDTLIFWTAFSAALAAANTPKSMLK
jgi:O-antigen ligase